MLIHIVKRDGFNKPVFHVDCKKSNYGGICQVNGDDIECVHCGDKGTIIKGTPFNCDVLLTTEE